MITRQLPVGEFFPLTGRGHLVAQALQAAMLAHAPRVLVCGGEERGTWLLDRGVASARTLRLFALVREPASARVTLEPQAGTPAEFFLPAFFDALVARERLDRIVGGGLRLTLDWS